MFCRYCGGAVANDSRFCSHCGQSLASPESAESERNGPPSAPDPTLAVSVSQEASKPALTNKSPRRRIECPVCHETSAMVKASTIVDEGMSTGVVAGVGGTVIGPAGLGVGAGMTQTRTQLARRLAPTARPKQNFLAHWFVWALAIWVVLALVLSANMDMGFVGFILGLMFGLIPALLAGLIGAVITVPLNAGRWTGVQREWDQKAASLREAYYCRRDDVLFNERFAGTPEQFKLMLDIPAKPRPTISYNPGTPQPGSGWYKSRQGSGARQQPPPAMKGRPKLK